MHPDPSRLNELFKKYFQKTASEAERAELAQLLEQDKHKDEIMKLFTAAWEQYRGNEAFFTKEKSDSMLEQILGNESQPALVIPMEPPRKIKWWRVTAAAAVLATLIITAIYTSVTNKKDSVAGNNSTTPVAKTKTANAVILTLDNGQQVVLDSAANGLLVQQNGHQVIKQADGLSYHSTGEEAATGFNTITTPRGTTYSNIILSDGSKVWLDAGSSIRFPVVFSGNERTVEVTGQVWLDVVHNEKMPFKVLTKGIEINDLGTQFNVNAYDDEPSVHVTLLQGVVNIGPVVLKPGQQAQVNPTADQSIRVIDDVAVDQVIAWKNNVFRFKNTDLKTILRQAARWYDVEVIYATQTNPVFTGVLSRNATLAEFLQFLQSTGSIHFEMEEKKITVVP